ncbi:MAG: ABC transporter permease [Spirochaetota bacterium]
MRRGRVSSVGRLLAILRKDLLQFSRNRLYLALSLVSLVMFISFFWLIPTTVEEYAVIGTSYADLGWFEAELTNADDEGLRIIRFPDEDSLRRTVEKTAIAWLGADNSLTILDRDDRAGRTKGGKRIKPNLGLAFPDTFVQDSEAGRQLVVKLFVNNDTPVELQGAMTSMVREMVFMIAGHELPVSEAPEDEVVLGTDRTGSRIPLRDRLRPMLAFFVAMMETFAISALISTEIMQKTAMAIVATPASRAELLLSKVIFGTLLIFGQAVVLLAAVGAFSGGKVLILLCAAFMGALMFSGIAMLTGSLGKDFMGSLSWNMMIIIPFVIPAFSILFPGSAPPWVRLVPSWGLIEIFDTSMNFGARWSEVVLYFGISLVWVGAILGLGLASLSRKVARL